MVDSFENHDTIKAKCDHMSSEDIQITMHWIFRSNTPGGGTFFPGWTNV